MEEINSASGHRARLRSRFEKTGFNGFAEHEIVELLLTLCIPRSDVKPLARALVKRFGNLKGVLDAPIEALQEHKGMGSVAPVALRIIREAASLYLRQDLEEKPILNSIDKLADFWRVRLGDLKHEVFEVAYLDRSYSLMHEGVERLQEGDLDRAAVYPRRILEAAIKRKAFGLVFAHNHPVGQATPSPEDRTLTQSLWEAAKAIGIQVIDHIIISPTGMFSFRRSGLL